MDLSLRRTSLRDDAFTRRHSQWRATARCLARLSWTAVDSHSSRDFASGRYEPLRWRNRFVLLTPDMPVKFGSGHVCTDFARYATEALDAAVATGYVDGSRAGVMGISYGGYAVNCIITHSGPLPRRNKRGGPIGLGQHTRFGRKGRMERNKVMAMGDTGSHGRRIPRLPSG